jgi:hypothetical protein
MPRPLALLALTLCALTSLTSCTRGNGELATNKRSAAPFSYVSVRLPAYVEIRQGEAHAIEVSSDSNLTRAVSTYVTNETLFISSEQTLQPQLPIIVRLVMPNVEGVRTGLAMGVKLEDVDLERVQIVVEGEGGVVLTGEVDELTLDVKGQAAVDAVEAEIHTATINLDSEGLVDLNVTDTLAVTASSGTIRYVTRPPNVTEQLMGPVVFGRLDMEARAAEKLKQAGDPAGAPKKPDPKDEVTDEQKDAIDRAMGL